LALTDAKLRAAKAREQGYRLADGGGLHLYVAPSGIRSWRWRYERAGREQTLTLGRYPEIGLAAARSSRDAARADLRAGRMPGAAIAAVAASTFEDVARAWHAVQAPKWKPHHAADVLGSLEETAFLAFGAVPVAAVTSPMILTMLRAVEKRGAVETARRIRQRCSAVFAHAIGEGLAEADPSQAIKGALAPLPPKGHRPALLDLHEARACVAAVEALTGQPVTKLALRFLALTAARPGEVGGLRWDELHGLDGAEPLWRLPASRMKSRREHLIPLAPEAVECLETVRRLTGRGPLAFPNLRSSHRPMSENAMGYALIRAGYRGRHVPHGWRATFSTLMNERRREDRAIIDLMLAHSPRDHVEAAYNRAAYMPERRAIARAWAALLLDGRPDAAALLDGRRRG